ncbi:MAG: hypothetical protein JWO67_173 [Streptosporangiaceae bacterium]|nr:hypothetical protein [Streptosporangiaceae bacterium]
MERARAIPLMRLPISGWTVRVGRGAADRAALEVYEGMRMADVCVATPVSVSVLRGAWRNPRGGALWALAWGQLPAGVSAATAQFTGAGRNPAISRVPAVVIEGTYWVAEAAGDFAGVTVHAGPVLVSGRLQRSRSR